MQDLDEKEGTKWKYFVKYLSLFVLTTQTTVHILMLQYVRTRQGDMFLDSTAVVMAEVIKVITCLLIILYEEGWSRWLNSLYVNIILQPIDCLKISVPSLVYVLQNNLLYVALSNLDAAIFQVYYQLKILSTAIFSVIILRRVLSKLQWISLLILFVGVSVIQTHSGPSHAPAAVRTSQKPLLGMVAVILSCIMSGFAGVYFEKILKGSKQSIWIRNIQLGVIGSVLGLLTLEIKDGVRVQQVGFFFGYDLMVWLAILLQSLGGLTVAVVVKYADNILKGFASSFAIIASSIASIFLFNFELTIYFNVGASLVIASIYLYSKFPHIPSSLPLTVERTVHQRLV